jgi:hypothetical protein
MPISATVTAGDLPMPTRNVVLTELENLRTAVLVGVADFEDGMFKTFADTSALIAYLEDVGEAAISDVEGH